MKTLGIIGGLGPETTANFYMEVISSCAKINKKSRPSILITNVPVELEVEEKFIKHSKGKEKYLSWLIESAKVLEKGGADFIVIPCNSVHIFIDEIRKAVNIPVLSIVEETVMFLKRKRAKNVGLLATPFTIKNKLFDSKLKEIGIKVRTPDKKDQDKIGEIINRILQRTHGRKDKKDLEKIIKKLPSDFILLACTDLQLLIQKHSKLRVLDTTQILEEATVREILKGGGNNVIRNRTN
ncbi:MAG: amino acid racemase [Candidatus Levybacteria bacterium]|nr:amino acid racemase [Candidatus Levybacteria bacterium]